MGTLGSLLAVLGVPTIGAARQQRTASLLQPAPSETGYVSSGGAFFVPNTCCVWPNDRASSPGTCGEADDHSLNGIFDLHNWTAPAGAERVLRIRANHGSANFF